MTEGYWMWGWGLERVRKTEVRATPESSSGLSGRWEHSKNRWQTGTEEVLGGKKTSHFQALSPRCLWDMQVETRSEWGTAERKVGKVLARRLDGRAFNVSGVPKARRLNEVCPGRSQHRRNRQFWPSFLFPGRLPTATFYLHFPGCPFQGTKQTMSV